MKIVILDGYAANPGDLEWDGLEQLGDCTLYDRTSRDQVLERCKDANIVLTNKVPFKRETIEALPNLKYIGVMATGYNIIDTEAAKEKGIVVTNIPSYSTNSVAQMVFAHILNITLHVQKHSDEVHQGRWSKNADFCFWDSPLLELHGRTIGIIGLGSIGQAVARIAFGFGMKVIAYTSKTQLQLPHEIQKVELDELFEQADIVTLHCPLTDDTRNMVDKRRLELMQPTSIIINTSRGPLINEADLAEALKNKTIYAAGIDVMSQEPPKADNPLLGVENCYITPHIAWASFAARTRLMKILINNVKAFMEGKPENQVNK
ncbi:D-2-hydroxyacid dehydrogenase [Bacteroides coprosuis]|uniref:D-2-hydroxyacid dehydrogenase n=1 Tax=Bacteroides coprosuis TaxID=151276 RepID=UPI001DAF4A17|nr:D-2-hydroxyacid dehydrogenase [Bacteroides coprosuis]HJD91389.1 D-2-hydroxyacid dehydrogenase [Bacteroides coprosuis]